MEGRRQIEVAGERKLDVELGGPEDGEAVFFHTGTPSGGILYGPHVATGAERGMRHVCYSRPGYADSDRHEGRTVADCVEDVAAIADALGIDRFYTAGASGGAPHALACAALLGERVIGTAVLVGPAPLHAEGLDWFDGMAQENIEEYTAALEGTDPLVAFLQREAHELAGATGEALNDALGGLLSDVDRQTLSAGYAEHLAKSTRVAMRQGIWGWFDDDIAFVRDWGFDLGAVARPGAIWHGARDQFVPFAHGEWMAAHVSGARPHLFEDEGHLSLVVGNYGAVLDDLKANAA